MELFHIIILSLIQGVTEFLPISSSGHLLLPKELLGWPDQQLAFDVAVHLGTLIAVMAYFRKDIANLLVGWTNSVVKRQHSEDSKIAWYLILATIPAGLFGLAFDNIIEAHLRTTLVIAISTIVFGVLLGMADRNGNTGTKDLAALTLTTVLIIGFAQALALIPGTSRSGITITAALFCGFNRMSAARFSFLLSIPIILLSGAYESVKLFQVGNVAWFDLFLGAVLSCVSAMVCIHYFLRFINKIGMMPFVIYRLLLGCFLLLVAYNFI